MIQIEDAERLIVRWIRERPRPEYSNYGYEVYLSNVVRWWLKEQGQADPRRVERQIEEHWPAFAAAAWELCRRGIIRPGVSNVNQQSTSHGSGGEGYSVTPFGEVWAAESEHDDFVPTEPQRFAEMLAPYAARFGPGYSDRAQEAVRCYGAHAYLACAAMCGAAAESILLAAAVEKSGGSVLNEYASSQGRRRVTNRLLAHASKHVQQEFANLSLLLQYWRDEASHGKKSNIRDNEAYTSLALLLRLSMFVDRNWNELTSGAT